MAEQQTDKQTTTQDLKNPAPNPEQKSSPWILVIWILIPILFLIAVSVFRAT